MKWTAEDTVAAIVIGLIAAALIFCAVMIAWSQIDYNTKLINLEVSSCTADPQHCDTTLYSKYHK